MDLSAYVWRGAENKPLTHLEVAAVEITLD
jgi:hypothetical protein